MDNGQTIVNAIQSDKVWDFYSSIIESEQTFYDLERCGVNSEKYRKYEGCEFLDLMRNMTEEDYEKIDYLLLDPQQWDIRESEISGPFGIKWMLLDESEVKNIEEYKER